jgi:conjugative transfer signal peptidase TraF
MTQGTRGARWPLVLLVGSLIGLGWAALATSPPRLVYNASDSVPVGWYRISPANSLAPGDQVLVRLPREAMSLAAQRGYLPANVPLLKTVAAMAPQQVCVQGNQVRIDGELVAKRLWWDRQGRALPAWQACRRLVGDELFLLSSRNPASFDSRYFGPVSVDAVIGRAQPLWLESRRGTGLLRVDPPAERTRSVRTVAGRLAAGTSALACRPGAVEVGVPPLLITQLSSAKAQKSGGQDKRRRHFVSLKSSLHGGWSRHPAGAVACHIYTSSAPPLVQSRA